MPLLAETNCAQSPPALQPSCSQAALAATPHCPPQASTDARHWAQKERIQHSTHLPTVTTQPLTRKKILSPKLGRQQRASHQPPLLAAGRSAIHLRTLGAMSPHACAWMHGCCCCNCCCCSKYQHLQTDTPFCADAPRQPALHLPMRMQEGPSTHTHCAVFADAPLQPAAAATPAAAQAASSQPAPRHSSACHPSTAQQATPDCPAS